MPEPCGKCDLFGCDHGPVTASDARPPSDTGTTGWHVRRRPGAAMTTARRVRLLELADHLCHKLCDPYISAKPLGHHMPGWGWIQLWQHHLCNAYERAFDRLAANQQQGQL